MDGVAGWFERRGAIPLVAPFRLREYGPLSDDAARPDEGFSDSSISGVAFGIEYCDARGWASTRTVRCLALEPGPPAFLKAFCNVRGDERVFRVDRIISIYHLRTGAVLPGDAHVELLAPYIAEADADPSVAAMRNLHETARNGVLALLQLAMSAGQLDGAPRETVLAYVAAEAEACGCPLPPQESVELWVDNLSPPLEAIVAAVDALLAEREKFARLLPWLLKLVRGQEAFATSEESVRELIAEVRAYYRRKLLERPTPLRDRAG